MNPFKQTERAFPSINTINQEEKMKRPNELNKGDKSECTNYGLYVGVDPLN